MINKKITFISLILIAASYITCTAIPTSSAVTKAQSIATEASLELGQDVVNTTTDSIIKFVNNSPLPFTGWVRCNIDWEPPYRLGYFRGTDIKYVVGLPTSIDTRAIDIYLTLNPNERLSLDLLESSQMTPDIWLLRPPPTDIAFFGGPLTIAGVPFSFVDIRVDGAAYSSHLRAKVGRMLVTDIWLTWYPDQPGWCKGSVIVTASNPSVPDIAEGIPNDFNLRFGDALVAIPGLEINAPLMQNDWLADGQSRILPVTFVWPRHVTDWGSPYAIDNMLVQAVGIKKLHHCGNPVLPVGFDVLAWTNSMLPEAKRKLHTWEWFPLAPNRNSGDTGAQGGQSFVGGAPLQDPSALPVLILNAMKPAWPCNHLEADGSQLNYRGHPSLYMWYGRVNRILSPNDVLGKPTDPSANERHDHLGPNSEHWFHWTLWAATRYTGDPALQWLMSTHARLFLFQWKPNPPWWHACRAVGWANFLAAELYRGLEDRELAYAIKVRWNELTNQVFLPGLNQGDGYWDWRLDDPRLGPGYRSTPWQVAVMALGMDYAGEVFQHAAARDFAHKVAVDIINRTYVIRNSRWTSLDVITRFPTTETLSAGHYDFFGTPMAPATVLRHDPQNKFARTLWNQITAESSGNMYHVGWLCPGVN